LLHSTSEDRKLPNTTRCQNCVPITKGALIYAKQLFQIPISIASPLCPKQTSSKLSVTLRVDSDGSRVAILRRLAKANTTKKW